MAYKLLISGSRRMSAPMAFYARSVVCRAKALGWSVVVGDANGIDATVIDACKEMGVPYTIYGITVHPRNGCVSQYVKVFGNFLDRDRFMVSLADRAIGIWSGTSRGTLFTLREAVRRGIPADLINFADGTPVPTPIKE
jgi:hypothetical protein